MKIFENKKNLTKVLHNFAHITNSPSQKLLEIVQ